MCGRFTGCTKEQALAAIDDLNELDPTFSPMTSEPPDPDYDWPVQQPIIVPGIATWTIGASSSAAATPLLTLQHMTWGFTVTWKDGLIFNTRFESALSAQGMWTDAFATGRCIVLAHEFFEAHSTERILSPRTKRPIKRHYRFCAPDAPYLCIAGVSQGGRFSLVTVPPNQTMAPIHRRMPLVLSPDEARRWLCATSADIRKNAARFADRSAIDLQATPETDDPPLQTPTQLPLF